MEKVQGIFDDPVFPVFGGMVLESCGGGGGGKKDDEKSGKEKPKGILEAAVDSQTRAEAMSAVISWAENGIFSYDELDGYIYAMADIDGEDDTSENEEDYYNAVWKQIPDAMMTLGAGKGDVAKLVNDEDSAAAQRVGEAISTVLEEEKADDEELIVGFAYGEDAVLESVADDSTRHMILEATYQKRKVVRDGEVIVARKRVSGKGHATAKQKASLKKARLKAHTGPANLKRRKSMRLRERRGL